MNLPSTTLKSVLKRLSFVGALNTVFTPGRVSAMDGEVGAAHTLEHDFTFGVASKVLSAAVSKLSGQVDIEVKDGNIVLQSAKARFVLPVVSNVPAFFPALTGGASTSSGVLGPAISYVATACATDKAALNYTGSVKVGNGKAYGTDGKRLAVFVGAPKVEIILPLRLVKPVCDLEGDITIAQDENHIQLSACSITIHARKCAQKFPDFDQYLPKEFTTHATLKAEEMSRALDTVSPVVEPADENRVDLEFAGSKLVLTAKSTSGSATDEVPLEPDPFNDDLHYHISFNHRFLAEFFSAVSGEVAFKANGKNEPVLFEAGFRRLLVQPLIV